jgi:hypothetical protein
MTVTRHNLGLYMKMHSLPAGTLSVKKIRIPGVPLLGSLHPWLLTVHPFGVGKKLRKSIQIPAEFPGIREPSSLHEN